MSVAQSYLVIFKFFSVILSPTNYDCFTFSEGSVLVKYHLVFYGPVPNYNSTLKFACEGQEGYQEEPPEGWTGELTLPRGLNTMRYQIPPQTRKQGNLLKLFIIFILHFPFFCM